MELIPTILAISSPNFNSQYHIASQPNQQPFKTCACVTPALSFRDIETDSSEIRFQVVMDDKFVGSIFLPVLIGVLWLSCLCVFVFKGLSGWVKQANSWRQVGGQSNDQRIGGRPSRHRDLEEGTDLAMPPSAYVRSNLKEWTAPPPAYCVSGNTDLEEGTELDTLRLYTLQQPQDRRSCPMTKQM